MSPLALVADQLHSWWRYWSFLLRHRYIFPTWDSPYPRGYLRHRVIHYAVIRLLFNATLKTARGDLSSSPGTEKPSPGHCNSHVPPMLLLHIYRSSTKTSVCRQGQKSRIELNKKTWRTRIVYSTKLDQLFQQPISRTAMVISCIYSTIHNMILKDYLHGCAMGTAYNSKSRYTLHGSAYSHTRTLDL